MTIITGNTYPVRTQLAALGRKWDPKLRAWIVPDDKAEEARALANSVPDKRQRKRAFIPCGYPGCNSSYCDECDGKGRYGGDW